MIRRVKHLNSIEDFFIPATIELFFELKLLPDNVLYTNSNNYLSIWILSYFSFKS